MANINLEDVLLHSHNIDYVDGGECDYGPTVRCQCGWDGRPDEYGKHLLVVLGLGARVIDDWRRQLARGPLVILGPGRIAAGPSTAVDIHPLQAKDYLNLFLGPKDQDRLTKEERKELNNLWKKEA